MRKLPREDRLKHPVIVLLKKRDLEELKVAASESGMTQGAWARQFVMRGLDRAKKTREANSPETVPPTPKRRSRRTSSR